MKKRVLLAQAEKESGLIVDKVEEDFKNAKIDYNLWKNAKNKYSQGILRTQVNHILDELGIEKTPYRYTQIKNHLPQLKYMSNKKVVISHTWLRFVADHHPIFANDLKEQNASRAKQAAYKKRLTKDNKIITDNNIMKTVITSTCKKALFKLLEVIKVEVDEINYEIVKPFYECNNKITAGWSGPISLEDGRAKTKTNEPVWKTGLYIMTYGQLKFDKHNNIIMSENIIYVGESTSKQGICSRIYAAGHDLRGGTGTHLGKFNRAKEKMAKINKDTNFDEDKICFYIRPHTDHYYNSEYSRFLESGVVRLYEQLFGNVPMLNTGDDYMVTQSLKGMIPELGELTDYLPLKG